MSGSNESPLDAALNAGFSGNDGGGGGATEAASTEAATSEVETQADASAVAEQASESTQETAKEPAPPVERPRDAAGKFSKGAAATGAAPAPKETPKPKTPEQAAKPKDPATAPAAQTQPELKPPQNWTAAAREEWSKLPRHVQENAKRVEMETHRVMRESAQARAMASKFEETIAPYKGILSGEPMAVVGNLLQTAAVLQTAPGPQKAQLVATLIRNFGVDIQALDAILAGQEPPEQQRQPSPQRPEQFRDPRVDEMLAREEQQRTSRAQQIAAKFEQTAEFLDEPWPGKVRKDGTPVTVRHLVANLLEASHNDGVDLSLEQAYAQVVSQHPEITKVLRQREAARAAATAQAATQRTRAATSSVQSRPVTRPPGARNTDLNSVLEDAWTSAAGR